MSNTCKNIACLTRVSIYVAKSLSNRYDYILALCYK